MRHCQYSCGTRRESALLRNVVDHSIVILMIEIYRNVGCEWRLRTDALALDPAVCGIVLPEGDWERRLREAHAEQQAWMSYEYAQVLETNLAAQYEERFGWRIYSMGQP